MKTRIIFAIFTGLFAAGMPCAALAKSGAAGSVTINGVSWPVADAVATLDGENLEIVFAQKVFDRDAWADDGNFRSFDLWDFKDNAAGDARSLSIDIDEADGSYSGHKVTSASGQIVGSASEYENSVKLTARDEKHVAGTIKLVGGAIGAQVSFDLEIKKFGPLATPGTPLPAGGGGPGAAFKALVDATHAGNIEQMLATCPPKNCKKIEDAKAAGKTDAMLKMFQDSTPKVTKITGGSVNGDNAWVEFEGQQGGRAMKAMVTMNRIDAKWYLKGMYPRK